MRSTRLLADSLAHLLSDNALKHLRAARVGRHAELYTSPEELRGLLTRRGFPVHEALVALEARAGGAAFPQGQVLGAACFLRGCPSLRLCDLPEVAEGAAFPIFGISDHLAEWESSFCLVSASGAISLFDAPYGPVPAFSSLEHFLEVLAFAPLSDRLHTLRVDALRGELLAGLVGAVPHPPTMGEHTSGWIGKGVWVKELRIVLADGRDWSSHHGTFICTEDTDLLVEAIDLLLGQGFALGYRGPSSEPPPSEPLVLSFVDENPDLGYRARVRVNVWGRRHAYKISTRPESAAPVKKSQP
ncbi:hypothetical protein [Acrocarpospora catenulata]|uniref:hypothetical protein n=1 Tax=Acrocarpospora catenulata TaxID=2836182 RepID=UPI001BD9A9B5|nr:hypothetical protein [Acrocarpospora catenulata]